MDALPFCGKFLICMGIDWDGSRSKWRLCWSYFIRTVSVLTLLATILYQVYNIMYLDTVYLMAFAEIGIYTLQLICYLRLISKCDSVFRLLKQTFAAMEKQEICKIRNYDYRQSLLIVTYCMLCFIAFIVYDFENGIRSETMALSLAFRTEQEISPVLIMTSMAVYGCWTTVFSLFLQFYITALKVAIFVANSLHSDFAQRRVDIQLDFELRLRSLQWYNGLMRAINEDIGILPFALFGLKFIVFSCGIAFLITDGHNMQISPFFAALTVGGTNFLYLVLAIQVIEMANSSHKVMGRVWQMAEESVVDPVIVNTRLQNKDSERKALKFYLMRESVICAKACDSIVIDRSLTLSFASQLIPFTVMLFTSFKELQHKSTVQETSNSTVT